MVKKLFILILGVIILSSILSGCFGNENRTDKNDNNKRGEDSIYKDSGVLIGIWKNLDKEHYTNIIEFSKENNSYIITKYNVELKCEYNKKTDAFLVIPGPLVSGHNFACKDKSKVGKGVGPWESEDNNRKIIKKNDKYSFVSMVPANESEGYYDNSPGTKSNSIWIETINTLLFVNYINEKSAFKFKNDATIILENVDVPEFLYYEERDILCEIDDGMDKDTMINKIANNNVDLNNVYTRFKKD